ncbi:ATP-dependent DNA helicase [Halobium salinum]|uniref:ATP-dependent DNA helicase n=1 Tax=Halobium salinum TaxID=1364940 RepID=A0ABD5PFU9_9EURY|nr:ATP-dependent DNA helicase [Halobium salinum]
MGSIATALDADRDVLLEGAPGTGKTLSALVPALEHARREDRTVVITTNVHQQMRQFVADARAITRTEPIRAVVFRGKSSMCHIDVGYQECQTLRDTTRSVVEKEEDVAQLEGQEQALLDRMQGGDDGAAEARSAVMDELDSLEEELDDLRDGTVCEHYYNNLVGDNDEFYSWLFEDVRTPDEIYEFAEQRQLCGYELLKEGMEDVDLVVCNYHHLLDPMIREQFFRWLDCEPEEVITVFDEAHNVEGAARDHATRTLTENTLESAVSELEEADDSRAESALNVVGAFHRALTRVVDDNLEFGQRESVGEEWEDVPVANDDRRDDLTLAFLDEYAGRGIDTEIELALQLGKTLDEQYEDAYKNGESTTRQECQTLQAAAFVESWLGEGTKLGQYPVCAVRRDSGTEEVYGRAELYTCIPKEVTKALFDEVAASVLMSATLRPFDVTEAVLGLDDPETLAYGLAYPEENRRTYSVKTPALFASERDNPATQEVIADTLADVVRFTPGNALLFFPSYSEAERYHELLTGRVGRGVRGGSFGPDGEGANGPGGETGTLQSTSQSRTLYLDEPGTRTEELRQRFVAEDDAALFTSLWGTLAEGVSFDDEDARSVAVVGVPYPHLSERMDAVQDAYERTFGGRKTKAARRGDDVGWRYAVEIPTVRKTRQALGRVVRGPGDFGVRMLLDKRYTATDMGKYSVRSAFPSEERKELIDVKPEKLKFAMLNFYTDHDAYDGPPPQP